MALRISTTGTDVLLADLGINISDPTSNRDLSLEFTAQELKESDDLTNAIQNGDLLADDGQFSIDATDYNRNEVVNQELNLDVDERFISNKELAAGFKNTYIFDSVFPLSLNSTASSTRNVYSASAKWGTWSLEPGDFVTVSGSTSADGDYTVESVIDSQNFIVEESISDSTGGVIEIFHPAASTRVGIDPSVLSFTSATTLQEALEDISLGTVFDVNRMILETDGTTVYTGNGDLLITTTPLPQTVDQDF